MVILGTRRFWFSSSHLPYWLYHPSLCTSIYGCWYWDYTMSFKKMQLQWYCLLKMKPIVILRLFENSWLAREYKLSKNFDNSQNSFRDTNRNTGIPGIPVYLAFVWNAFSKKHINNHRNNRMITKLIIELYYCN